MSVPTIKPFLIYPVGTILEDPKMKMKVLEFRDTKTAHTYKVEVLEWKIPPKPEYEEYVDMKTPWIIVLPQYMDKIKILSE